MAAWIGCAQAADWTTYANDRFGAMADIPASYKPGEPPDGTKDNIDASPIFREMNAWSERKKSIASRLTGGLTSFSV